MTDAATRKRLTEALRLVCGDHLLDQVEARARFIEEALELAQAAGATLAEVEWSARRVFAKPADPIALEVGRVSTALHRLAISHGVSVADEARRDLEHIEENHAYIAARHSRKVRYTSWTRPSEKLYVEPCELLGDDLWHAAA